MAHKLCRLRRVPASNIMDWLAKQRLTILSAEIKADKNWIALEISEVQLRHDLVLFDLNAHITFVKLDKETCKSVDLRDAKELAEWHLQQCRLQSEFEISIMPTSRISPDHPYQCRDLIASSPFFNALQTIKLGIMLEMNVEDPRWPHLSIPGESDPLVLASSSQFGQLACDQWVSAHINYACMRSSASI